MINWRTEKRKVTELKDYKNNPRIITSEGLAKLEESFAALGYIDPIAINVDNTIIGGHARKSVLKKLKIKEVDVRVPDRELTEKEIDQAIIRLNKNIAGEWDFDKLANCFDANDLLDWGFTEEELSFSVEKQEGLTDEDYTPEPPETPVTIDGDIWILGAHRLMCGDSTSIDAVEKLMDGKKADMLLTDPPYNVDYKGKTKDSLSIKNDKMNNSDFRKFLSEAFIASDNVMKKGAVFYIWHADIEGFNFRGACVDTGWIVRQCLIWQKQTMVFGRQDYHCMHEPCLYGWKDGAGHLWASDRKQTTILKFDRPSRNSEHPTMKPVNLFEYQMLNNTKGSDVVLDLFAGSGTTAIAAEKNNRCAMLMELDPKYCDVIIKRWQEYTGKKAIHAETGIEFAG